MSIVRIACLNTYCRARLRVGAKQSGQKIRCPVCGSYFIAPKIAGAGITDEATVDGDEAVAEGLPLWKTVMSLGLLFIGLGLLVVLSAAFEVWHYYQTKAIFHGSAVEVLTAHTWQVSRTQDGKGKKTNPVSFWSTPGVVWTFRDNGTLETGKLLENRKRYDRDPEHGYRIWNWKIEDGKLAVFKDGGEQHDLMVDEKPGKLHLSILKPPDDGMAEVTLVMSATDPVDEFPGLKTVFYAGVLTPTLVGFLLTWLISREVFHRAGLRLVFGWILAIPVGTALGAGFGYLLDMLNDHSHFVMPYWLLLAAVNGGLAIVVGFGLGLISSLRTT